MNIPTICHYCGGEVILCDSSVVYEGRSYGNIYLCTNCRAYVGAHKATNKPLGTLADAPLRKKRIEAHAAFDAWWQAEEIDRTIAYRWLAEILGLPVKETHIARFDIDMCDKVIEICRDESEAA